MLKDWFHGVRRSLGRRKIRRQLVKRFGSRNILIDFKSDRWVSSQSVRITAVEKALKNLEKQHGSKSDDK